MFRNPEGNSMTAHGSTMTDCRSAKPTQVGPTPISHRPKVAAQLVGISDDAMMKLVSSGVIKCRRIGLGEKQQRFMTLIPHSELVRVFGLE